MATNVIALAGYLAVAVFALQGQQEAPRTPAPQSRPTVGEANADQKAPATIIPPLFPQWATFAANVATTMGIVFAVLVFLRDRSRERRQREMTTYSTLTAMYHDYLRFCFDHPGLSSMECDPATERDSRQRRDQDLFLFMVVNMLENAYFQYREQDTKFRSAQWNGWEDYTKSWLVRPEFEERFPSLVEMFDADFYDHIKRLYAEVHSSASLTPNPDAGPGPGAPATEGEHRTHKQKCK